MFVFFRKKKNYCNIIADEKSELKPCFYCNRVFEGLGTKHKHGDSLSFSFIVGKCG